MPRHNAFEKAGNLFWNGGGLITEIEGRGQIKLPQVDITKRQMALCRIQNCLGNIHLRWGILSQCKFKVKYTKPLLKWEVNPHGLQRMPLRRIRAPTKLMNKVVVTNGEIEIKMPYKTSTTNTNGFFGKFFKHSLIK